MNKSSGSEARLVGYRQPIKRAPASANANEIGAAVNESSIVVGRESLLSMVSDREIVDRNVPGGTTTQ
jgi:hypothetical protein